jgi:hypothetical protein
MNGYLEEELKKIEGVFEKNEVIELWKYIK